MTVDDFLAKNTGCGLGYRASTTYKTIQLLHTLGGRAYLLNLRNLNINNNKDDKTNQNNQTNKTNKTNKTNESNGDKGISDVYNAAQISEIRTCLLQFPGVGPKVADCVALFSLNQFSIVVSIQSDAVPQNVVW